MQYKNKIKLRLINSAQFNFECFFFIIPVKLHHTIAAHHECYVCGGLGAAYPFKNSKDFALMLPSSCDEFEQSENLDTFLVTCPEDYVGCITQTDG